MSDPLTILQGDALAMLRTLPDESAHCCVTSPPYWGLRDYGVAGQIGLEETPDAYVSKMVEVFSEVRRVLRKDGTAWVNLGDSYTSGGRKERDPGQSKIHPAFEGDRFADGLRPGTPPGLKPKDLCGIPWRVAFALQADGWYLRSDIIWHKPNPMPESVTDRPTKAHEYVFMLSKSQMYFYDAEAVKEEQSGGTHARFGKNGRRNGIGPKQTNSPNGLVRDKAAYNEAILPGGRNRRSVWTIATEAYPGSHFATYPTSLVKPCILAGTSARGCCPKCGKPWERVMERVKGAPESFNGSDFRKGKKAFAASNLAAVGQQERTMEAKTVGWLASCNCENLRRDTEPCTVLDPFAGSGTTGQVALELCRRAVLIELNPDYVAMIRQRCAVTPGLQLA